MPGHGHDHIVSAILAELSNPTPEMTEAGACVVTDMICRAVPESHIRAAFLTMIAEAGK